MGVVLHDQGRFEEAINAYHQAISARRDVAIFHANLGHALQSLGKLEESTAAYYDAVRIEPNDADLNFNLGVILRKRGMPDDAAVAFQKSISSDPKNAVAYYDLAIVLHETGKLDEAIAAYRKALSLKPNFADAHNGLGTALMDYGRFSDAQKSLERAVKLAPDNARYWRGVSIITKFSEGDPKIAEMERLLASASERSADDQIELRFALGKAYDDVGRRADAFTQWLAGNALKRKLLDYDEHATLNELDQVQTVFTPELISTAKAIGHQSSSPIFIVGMPRSGTTLVEQIIANYSSVYGGGELPFFRSAVEAVTGVPGVSAFGADGIRKVATHYLAQIKRISNSAPKVTDKMPRNFIFVGLIHLTFPNAPIISVTRDPRDTCLSCFSKLFSEEQDFTFELSELGRYYRHYQGLMMHWRHILPPERILDVRYEDVVNDLEGETRRIIAYCGLDWDPKCLSFYKTKRPVRTASTLQVRRPIYDSSIGRWHLYSEWLRPLLRELEVDLPLTDDTKSNQ